MKAENLNFPLWLIDKELKYCDYILNIKEISFATLIAIKNETMINCYIYDSKKYIFIINNIFDRGRFIPKVYLKVFNLSWYFNPLKNVELEFSSVDVESTVRTKIENLILEYRQNHWGEE